MAAHEHVHNLQGQFGSRRSRDDALFHLATRYLDEQAARPTAMADFCRAVGQGRPWREAFAAAFGLPVDAFYARFAAARPGLIAGL